MNSPWAGLITFLLIENRTVIAEHVLAGNLFKEQIRNCMEITDLMAFNEAGTMWQTFIRTNAK